MNHNSAVTEESILVCVYYGANGERLIRRGHKLATLLKCPLYVLNVDTMPFDAFDAEKTKYIERWKSLVEELNIAQFIIKDNEKRPIAKVINEVAQEYNITQIIVGQSAQSRWEEITKGAFINVLLKEVPFVDFHIVSVKPVCEDDAFDTYEKGVRAYIISHEEELKLSFTCPKASYIEGIFFKEIGTDFDNGIFKFIHENKMYELTIREGEVVNPERIPSGVELAM